MKRHFFTIGFLLFLNAGPGFAATLNYTYDAAGRLTGIAYDNGTTITYTYDAVGNRTNKTVTIPRPLPDLVIQSARVLHPARGGAHIEVVVLNQGNREAYGPIHLGGRPNWYVKDGLSFNDTIRILARGESLPAGATVTRTFYWTAAASWEMTIDSGRQVEELNEANNTFTLLAP